MASIYRTHIGRDQPTSNPRCTGTWGPRLSSPHARFTFSPSRRTQEGSKDNATLRLDSSLETPTVNSPRCLFRQCVHQPSWMNAFTAISLEV